MSDAAEGANLREIVSTLRAEHRALDRRVSTVEKSVMSLPKDIESRHQENRQSIHQLRNGQQVIIDLVHKIDLKLAKMTGYAVGAGAVVALVVKFVDHVWKS